MRFVDDDDDPAAGGEFTESAFAPFDEIHRGDDTGFGAPGIGTRFERPPRLSDTLAVEYFELETKLRGYLRLPLLADGGGADDQNPRRAPTGVQFAQDKASLDSLAESYVVGNEESWAWQFQRSKRRYLLVRFEFN